MKREFIYTARFDREWAKQKLTDEDLRQLELYLIESPEAGVVMKDAGGLRKLRWALPGKGKSGGMRILYVEFGNMQIICMVDLFSKDEKENLSQSERNAIGRLVKEIREELRNERTI